MKHDGYENDVKPNPTRPRTGAWVALWLCLVTGGYTPLYAQTSAANQQFVFAYRLFQRQDYKLAAEAFDNYLAKFPKDEKYSDALFYRALLSRKTGRNAEALAYLNKAISPKHVPDHAVLFLKGQIYSDLQQPEKAVQTLEMIDLQTLDSDMRASIYYLRAKAYRSLKNLPAAATQLKEVIKIDSSLQPRAMLDLARIQIVMKLPADALKTLKRCLALNNPQVSAEAARLAGDLAFELHMYPMAVRYYKTILTAYTTSKHMSAAITGTLWAMFQQKQYSQVLATFEQYHKRLAPENRVTGWYLAGASQQEMGRFDKAVELFGAIFAAASGSKLEDKVLYRLAASQFEIGQFSGMTQTIAKLRKAYPDSPRLADAGFLMASAALKQGDTATAAARLTAIIDAGQKHPYYTQALLLRAKLYESTGKLAPAVADYEQYVAVYPQAASQIKLNAKTLHQAMLRLVDLNYQLKRFEASDQVAARLLKTDKLDPLIEAEGLYRRSLTQIKLKQFASSHQLMTLLLKKHPANHYRADALYYRGLLAMMLKKPDDAIVDFQAAAASDHLSRVLKINAIRLTARLLREKKKSAEVAAALKSLEQLVGTSGLKPNELIWLGRYHVDRHEPDKAMEYLVLLLEGKIQTRPATLSRAMMLGGRAMRAQKNLEGAIDAFGEVVSMSRGQGYDARLELAKTLVMAGRYEDALDEYEGLISAEKSAIAAQALFELAHLHRTLVQQKLRQSDESGAQAQRHAAIKALKRLVLLFSFPELSPLPQLSQIELAELAKESGQDDASRAQLKELIEQYPQSVYATYAQAVIAKMDGRKIVARGLLQKIRHTKDLAPQLNQRVKNELKVLGGGG